MLTTNAILFGDTPNNLWSALLKIFHVYFRWARYKNNKYIEENVGLILHANEAIYSMFLWWSERRIALRFEMNMSQITTWQQNTSEHLGIMVSIQLGIYTLRNWLINKNENCKIALEYRLFFASGKKLPFELLKCVSLY